VSRSILFIEDEDEYHKKNLETFRSTCPGLTVNAAKTTEEAAKFLGDMKPAILITDLAYPDRIGEHAKTANGTNFLRFMIEQTAEAPRLPIWIVSASGRNEVIETIYNIEGLSLSEWGYTIVAEDADERAMIALGAIVVLPASKIVSRAPRAMEALALLNKSIGSGPTKGGPIMHILPTTSGDLNQVLANPVRIDLSANVAEQMALRRNRNDVIIVQKTNGVQLEAALQRWFALPPVTDPGALPGLSRPSLLCSAARHSNVLLHLPLADANSIDLAIRYWLLWHNISFKFVEDEQLVRYWRALLQEPGGPLKIIRHGVRNLRFQIDNPHAALHCQRIDQVTTEIENKFVLPAALIDPIDQFAGRMELNNTELFSQLLTTNFIADVSPVQVQFSDIRDECNRLDALLDPYPKCRQSLHKIKLSCDAIIALLDL
jgi:hypothetical protein